MNSLDLSPLKIKCWSHKIWLDGHIHKNNIFDGVKNEGKKSTSPSLGNGHKQNFLPKLEPVSATLATETYSQLK